MATELNTHLDFLPDYLQRHDDNTLPNRSFMSAMEEARQQQTPMYKAQLQQIQQQNALAPLRAQMLGYQVKDAALGYEMQQFAREDAIAGKEQAKMMMQEMATISHKDGWDNPASLDNLYAINAKHPTATGNQILKEAEARHQTAVQQKNLADFRKSQQELLKARVDAAAGNTFETKFKTLINLQIARNAAAEAGDTEGEKYYQDQLDVATALISKTGQGMQPGEIMVKDLGNGKKAIWLQGSKGLHILSEGATLSEFLTKNTPLLLKDHTAQEATSALVDAWQQAQSAVKTQATEAAPVVVDPKDPLGVLKKR